jgi:hypothetical protein
MAAGSPPGPIQLDHLLSVGVQEPGQPGAIAAGALDCPYPLTMVLIGQLKELLVAVGGGGQATVRVARVRLVTAARTAAVWVCLWVSTPMTTSTQSAGMAIALCSLPGDDVVGAGPGRSTAGL